MTVQNDELIHHLDIKVQPDDSQVIKNTLATISGVASLSSTQLYTDLINKGPSAEIFLGLKIFLTLVEKFSTVTYQVGNDFTIGIGLDLTVHPEAIALFYQIDPKRDWEKEFPKMREKPSQPQPPLTGDQVYELLYWTLLGVENKHGKFVGLTKKLISQLNRHNPGLANVPFKPYQLITLQSLAFNNPELISPNLCKALVKLAATGNERDVMIEILEHSNLRLDIGLQNRRLKEAALFHYFVDDVQLYWRLVGRLLAANPDTQLVGGLPLNGLSYGKEQQTYLGAPTITIDPGLDPQHLDSLYYGSYGNDLFTDLQGGSKVIFGGGGNDKITLAPAINLESFHYLAGNEGEDEYDVSKQSGQTLIYDIDRRGHLIIGGKDWLQGIAVAEDSSNTQFKLCTPKDIYQLTRQNSVNPQADTEKTMEELQSLLHITWGDNRNSIRIANFLGGQFNMALVHQPQLLVNNLLAHNDYRPMVVRLTHGELVTPNLIVTDKTQVLEAVVFDQHGNFLKTFTLATLVMDENSRSNFDAGRPLALANNQFLLPYKIYVVKFLERMQTTQINYVIASPAGVQQTKEVTLPDGGRFCKYNQISNNVDCVIGRLVPVMSGNNYVIVYDYITYSSYSNFQTELVMQSATMGTSKILLTFPPSTMGSLQDVTSLPDGSIGLAYALEKSGVREMYAAVSTAQGKITHNEFYTCLSSKDIMSITGFANGFWVAATNKIQSQVTISAYSLTKGWSTPVIKFNPGLLVTAVLVRTLGNDNAIMLWTSTDVSDFSKTYAMIVDEYNQPMGEPSVVITHLGTWEDFIYPGSTLLLPNHDMWLTFIRRTAKSISIHRSYLEAAALQPRWNQNFTLNRSTTDRLYKNYKSDFSTHLSKDANKSSQGDDKKLLDSQMINENQTISSANKIDSWIFWLSPLNFVHHINKLLASSWRVISTVNSHIVSDKFTDPDSMANQLIIPSVLKQEPNNTQSNLIYQCTLTGLPWVDEIVETIVCENSLGRAYFFEKIICNEQSLTLANDTLNHPIHSFLQCRPVEFYGTPSVYCENETVSVVYTSFQPQPPCENLAGQVGLAFVAFHWLGRFYHWLVDDHEPTIKENPRTTVNNENISTQLKELSDKLNVIEFLVKQINQKIDNQSIKWAIWAIEEYRDDLAKLKSTDSQEELEELTKDIHHLYDEVNKFRTDLIESVSSNTELKTNPFLLAPATSFFKNSQPVAQSLSLLTSLDDVVRLK